MKKGFTMAEVLITLGIIGIVAAMTLPTLMSKYDLHVRQQQFKKAYSVLSNALQKADFELSGAKCYYTRTGKSANETSECSLLFSTMTKYFNKIKFCESNALAQGCLPPDSYKGGESVYSENNPSQDTDEAQDYFTRNCGGFNKDRIENNASAYIFNDGLIVIPYTSSTLQKLPLFAFDINGHKGPNKWGYDLFVTYIRRNSDTSAGLILDLSSTTTCHPVEKGGYSAQDFYDLMNR